MKTKKLKKFDTTNMIIEMVLQASTSNCSMFKMFDKMPKQGWYQRISRRLELVELTDTVQLNDIIIVQTSFLETAFFKRMKGESIWRLSSKVQSLISFWNTNRTFKTKFWWVLKLSKNILFIRASFSQLQLTHSYV